MAESMQFFNTDQGARLAYRVTPGRSPGIMFLTGFMSDMQGSKALYLEQHLRARGNQFLRFDYRGHGASSERFESGSIGDWADDALAVLDHLTTGPQVLVGSSMGGWIALLLARARPERVAGLVGIATAADFTTTLANRHLNEAQRQTLTKEGQVSLQSCYDGRPYIITRHLIDEGRRHHLLEESIAYPGPVRLIQGMEDPDVPWQTSLRILERLQSNDVALELIKDGDHRLSSPEHLERLRRTLDALLDQLEEQETP